jgi:hypothetical protein
MRKLSSLFTLAFILTALLAILPKSATAQDADPPGRVARLNYIQGSVSYQVSGDTTWVDADTNRPLTAGDNLWADKDSRGEVHIGSTAIRLSSETGISFLTLDDRTVQIQLAQGTIEVHLRHHVAGDAFEIDTPNLALTLTKSGEYRIDTDPNANSTTIVMREGEGEVTGGGESYTLDAGQQYTFTGTDQLTYADAAAPGFDDFEDWCQARDQQENNAVSAQYVSRDVDGYYDLDQYGTWEADPDYGQIWVPTGVAVGWAPYHLGHWVYIAPWGWTWVDDEPWGFAPFHYGRWAYVSDHWGWVPGPMVVRPVYAPALVAFVGGGGFGFSVSFGGGFNGIGWFPLGPRDVYIPGYRCSPRYFQTVNVTNTRIVNVTQVRDVYNTAVVNRDMSHVDYMYSHNEVAITAVPRDTFVNARPVGTAAIRVTPDQILNARVTGSAPVQPTRSSYVSANAKVATAKPAVPFEQRPVVAKLPPATPVRNERTPVYTNDSRPFNQETPSRASNASPTAPGNSAQPAARDGFRPFTPPAGGNTVSSRPNNPTFTQPNNTIGSPAAEVRNDRRPNVNVAPPEKAREDMYDIHPPLNQKQSAPPKQEAPRTQSTPRSEPHQESRQH